MIISKKYAQKLVREGKAKIEGRTTDGYIIITRYDLQRTDHYDDD
jgi:hypothetical protein